MTVNVTENKHVINITETHPSVISVQTQGIQGASFSSTNRSMDDSGKVDGSVAYFDAVADMWKADSTRTVLNLVDGANF